MNERLILVPAILLLGCSEGALPEKDRNMRVGEAASAQCDLKDAVVLAQRASEDGSPFLVLIDGGVSGPDIPTDRDRRQLVGDLLKKEGEGLGVKNSSDLRGVLQVGCFEHDGEIRYDFAHRYNNTVIDLFLRGKE